MRIQPSIVPWFAFIWKKAGGPRLNGNVRLAVGLVVDFITPKGLVILLVKQRRHASSRLATMRANVAKDRLESLGYSVVVIDRDTPQDEIERIASESRLND